MAGPPNPPVLVVLPAAQQTNAGNSAVAFPWDLTTTTGATSLRYQQVYGASDFSNVSGAISQIGFRVAAASGSGAAFDPVILSNVTIVLSTTPAAPDGLSATFGDNTGPDATTVFQGPLPLSSSDAVPPGAGAAAAFDVRVCLQTPFNYNPANGNLLLDIAIDTDLPGGLATSYFDGENTKGDSVSRVWAANAGATKATTVDSKGVITQFMFGNTGRGIQPGISWFMTLYNFQNLTNKNWSECQKNFNNSQTYIMTDNSTTGPTRSVVPAGWSAIGGIDFKALADLKNAISNGWLGFASASPDLEVLSYDNESWSNTPPDEQSNAAVCEALFANLAHAYGYGYVATPAMDIMNDQPACSGTDWKCYLNLPCPTFTFPVFSALAPADIYEIQAQKQIGGIDTNNYAASTYNELVSGASSQALAANSNVVVFAGINSGEGTIQQLYESVIDSVTNVSGYWLNCGSGDADEAIQLLELLDAPPPPQFATSGVGPLIINSNGTGQLNFTGTPGSTYHLWASANAAWTPVTNTWTLLGTGTFRGVAASFTITLTNTQQYYVITQP